MEDVPDGVPATASRLRSAVARGARGRQASNETAPNSGTPHEDCPGQNRVDHR